MYGFPGGGVVKNPPCQCRRHRDVSSVSGSGRSPGEGNANPLQYSCLVHPMDRGACQATIHGVTESLTWLSMHTASSGKEAIAERRQTFSLKLQRNSRISNIINRDGLQPELFNIKQPCLQWSLALMFKKTRVACFPAPGRADSVVVLPASSLSQVPAVPRASHNFPSYLHPFMEELSVRAVRSLENTEQAKPVGITQWNKNCSRHWILVSPSPRWCRQTLFLGLVKFLNFLNSMKSSYLFSLVGSIHIKYLQT